MKIRNLFALLLVSAFALTSCNNDRGLSDGTENRPQDVIVSLDLGDGLRAIGGAQDLIANDAAATVENVDVYLTTADGTIKVAQRFVKDSDEFNKLTSAAAIGNAGGYKFKNVEATVTRASVVVNPQAAALAVSDNVNTLQVNIRAMAGDAVYSELNKALEALGVEPIEPNPGTKENVKKVNFDLKGDMSRFQVATVFSVIEFKDEAAKTTFTEWKKQYVQDNPGVGRTYDHNDADYVAAQKEKFGSYEEGVITGDWGTIWKVVKVTAQNKGVFMNDFDNTLTLTDKKASERLVTTTYAGAYVTTNGDLTLNTKDVSSVASYYNTNGFTTSFTTDPKVLAFNFFAAQALNKDLKEKGNAPRLHFFFEGDNVDADHQFVNFTGYKLDGTFKEAQLLNIDMSKINGGDGVIVKSEDPTVPENGKPDVENEAFNLIVRVTVANWTAVNVTPIAE